MNHVMCQSQAAGVSKLGGNASIPSPQRVGLAFQLDRRVPGTAQCDTLGKSIRIRLSGYLEMREGIDLATGRETAGRKNVRLFFGRIKYQSHHAGLLILPILQDYFPKTKR
jgi:hypothetical protein